MAKTATGEDVQVGCWYLYEGSPAQVVDVNGDTCTIQNLRWHRQDIKTAELDK
jgi:hypothetical protein